MRYVAFVALPLSLALLFGAASLSCATSPGPADEPKTTEADLGPVAAQLARAEQPPDVIAHFEGTFDELGVRVTDTGEEFTAIYDPERVRLAPGITDDAMLTVELSTEELGTLVEFAEDGRVDDDEAFRIMAALFTPVTRQTLAYPAQNSAIVHELLGVEDVIHVYLLDAGGEPAASHTVSFEEGGWIVREGIHGTPERVFELTADDARTYQRRAFTAIREDSAGGWLDFAEWYAVWREEVSVPPPAGPVSVR